MSLFLASQQTPGARTATVDEASDLIDEAWMAGERWFAASGDDAFQHAVAKALLTCASRPDAVALEAPIADDPFAKRARDAVIAYRPLGDNGLARTFGLDLALDMPEERLSGTLDVGRVVSATVRTHLVVGATALRWRGPGAIMINEVDRRPGRADPGERHLSLEGASLIVTNGQYLLEQRVSPHAIPTDGALDLGVLRAGRFRERGVWRATARGDRVPTELLETALVDRIDIPLPLELAVDAAVAVLGPLDICVERTRIGLWI